MVLESLDVQFLLHVFRLCCFSMFFARCFCCSFPSLALLWFFFLYCLQRCPLLAYRKVCTASLCRYNLNRCATAFNAKAICLVGSRQFNAFGAHGADAHVAFRHYASLEDCCQHLKSEERCEIVGIEIDDSAKPVQSHPFSGPTAFLLGNEGQGLSQRQLRCCDKLVYIPQYGCGTASLNVAVAASIVLHHFAVWAEYDERPRKGQKFIVEKAPQRTAPRGVVPPTAEEFAAMLDARRRQRHRDEDGVFEDPNGDDSTIGMDFSEAGAPPTWALS